MSAPSGIQDRSQPWCLPNFLSAMFQPMNRGSQNTTRRLAILLIVASCSVLAGWQFRIAVLKGAFLGSFVAPNTALCMFLCAVSILLQGTRSHFKVRFGQAIGAFVLLFATATLWEWTFTADFGI